MTGKFCSLFLGSLPLLLALRSAMPEEPAATLSRVSGEVVVQHGAALLRPAAAKAKGEAMKIEPGDTLRTRNGEAEVSYGNGSAVRVRPSSVALFVSKAEKEESDEDRGPAQLRVRVAIGAISASIKPRPSSDPIILEKAVFLLPQGRIALLDGDVDLAANEVGDWQCGLNAAQRALITELSMRLMWQAQSGQKFRVQYLPGGVRISNLGERKQPVAIGLYADGGYEVAAVKGDVEITYASGERKPVRERSSVFVALPPPGTVIRGIDPGEAVMILHCKKPT